MAAATLDLDALLAGTPSNVCKTKVRKKALFRLYSENNLRRKILNLLISVLLSLDIAGGVHAGT